MQGETVGRKIGSPLPFVPLLLTLTLSEVLHHKSSSIVAFLSGTLHHPELFHATQAVKQSKPRPWFSTASTSYFLSLHLPASSRHLASAHRLPVASSLKFIRTHMSAAGDALVLVLEQSRDPPLAECSLQDILAFWSPLGHRDSRVETSVDWCLHTTRSSDGSRRGYFLYHDTQDKLMAEAPHLADCFNHPGP